MTSKKYWVILNKKQLKINKSKSSCSRLLMLFSCKYIYIKKENTLNIFANNFTVLFCAEFRRVYIQLRTYCF